MPTMILQIHLLFLPHLICGVLKLKCPLNLKPDEKKPLNFYRSGDTLISGIASFENLYDGSFLFDSAPIANNFL